VHILSVFGDVAQRNHRLMALWGEKKLVYCLWMALYKGDKRVDSIALVRFYYTIIR
jgi:hypothetical protein